MNNDYKIEIMNHLVKKKSLRDAIKWLDTSMGKLGKTPAELVKEGKADKVLKFLKQESN
jgi:hypothetical protein